MYLLNEGLNTIRKYGFDVRIMVHKNMIIDDDICYDIYLSGFRIATLINRDELRGYINTISMTLQIQELKELREKRKKYEEKGA